MLERARTGTRGRSDASTQYARYADDLVILVDPDPRRVATMGAVRRLREEFDKLDVEVNAEKSRIVDLSRGELRIPGV